ncbi:hypothetical protein D0962_05630 [Leptolyngbyaceae cyanobacterium CCMR0082]|uniref:Uncharacterized protein n=1 Tax=Adonisia turfae CCMR0082 TaxID=2304604 RepID=A0A6M0S1Y4_9CYAN|nr:hypothetical protein [Adonisia turfae]NEZ62260.1 hypothetical protein [Adonisia turfae CCMR0082]
MTNQNHQITIENTYPCTQREMVVRIANRIYQAMDCNASGQDPMYFYDSQHPTERAILAAAEEIFGMFWGDSPDYDDEDDE